MKSIDPKGSNFTYEYTTDGKRNLTKATSAENVVYSFEYDAHGNAKKATVGTGTTFMASNATYTASGNYVHSVTDSAGNVVTYSYDETKRNLSSVKDPKNSASAYTYDANTDALTGVSKTVEGSVASNDYTYLNDRLRTITHNGFSYDVLGSNTSYRYVYDPNERLIKITGSEGSSLVYVVIVMPSNPYANARLK